jgi:hypothetical protein
MSTRKTVLALDDTADGKRIRVSVDGVRLLLIVPGPAPAACPAESPPMWHPDWLVFSDTECQVLLTLLDDGPQKRDTVAGHLGRPLDGSLREIIANLSNRLIIVNTPDGFRVNRPAEQLAAFREWLADQGPGRAKPRGGYRLSGPKLAPQEPRPDDIELAGRIEAAHEAKRRAQS